MMHLVASDLDRTLIYSPRALGPSVPELTLVERDDEGEPLSYFTARAGQLLAELAQWAVFVPVTTRTLKQYRRIELPVAARYAICANGGRLLVAGKRDRDWETALDARLSASGVALAEVVEQLQTFADPRWTRKQRVAEDLFAYLVIERKQLPAGWLAELTGWCAERGWTVSLQGRKVYAVPRALTKSAAVAEVTRRLDGPCTVLAAGDSLLDADLLLAADAGWHPGHGELAEQGWTAPGVTGLATRGVRAGEEILATLLARVTGGQRPA
ncbi:HAD family hydrolase [Kitasatospora azatica]|uniref:hypothetical protein n=1 Tax=Kitasatospora azatica TaxID=58347 RepID=UPI00055E8277|nr:hypothetical protein [Kitasatospora azatica]